MYRNKVGYSFVRLLFCNFASVLRQPAVAMGVAALLSNTISTNMNNLIKDNILKDSILETAMPHIFHLTPDGTISEGNAMGKAEGWIYMPEGWLLEDNSNADVVEVPTDDNHTEMLIHLSKSDVGPYRLTNEDDEYMDFFPGCHHASTVAMPSPQLICPFIKTPLYLDGDVSFVKRLQGEEDKPVRMSMIMFRRAESSKWLDDAPLGYIYARALTMDDDFVKPVRMLNLGVSPAKLVDIVETTDKKVVFRITWPLGTVEVQGCRETEEGYEAEKARLGSDRSVNCIFTSKVGRKSFAVRIELPFQSFAVCHNGEEIAQGQFTIPVSLIDQYTYQLPSTNSDERLAITFEQPAKTWQYVLSDRNTLTVRDMADMSIKLGEIPTSGTFADLLMGMDNVRAILEPTAGNWNKTRTNIILKHKDERWRIHLANHPYRLTEEDGSWQITSKALKTVIVEDIELKAMSLDCGWTNPQTVTMLRSDDWVYTLPDEATGWQKVFIYSSHSGIVYPKAFCMAERRSRNMLDMLADGPFMNAAWTECIAGYDTAMAHSWPTDSVPELELLSDHPSLLSKFVFHLFLRAQADNSIDKLEQSLMQLQADLAFQWFWLDDTDYEYSEISYLADSANPKFMGMFEVWKSKTFGEEFEIPAKGDDLTMLFALLINQFEGFMSSLSEKAADDKVCSEPDMLDVRRNNRKITRVMQRLSGHNSGEQSLWMLPHDDRKEILHVYRNYHAAFQSASLK